MTSRRTPPHAFPLGTNPLSRAECGRAADALAWNFEGSSDDDISLLLMLCHAFTYERDLSAREGMLISIEETLGNRIPGFDGFVAKQMRRQLDRLRKGGAG